MAMNRLIIALALMLVSLAGKCDPVIVPHGKITRIHFWPNHDGALIAHEFMAVNHGCPRADLLILRQSNPLFKEMYAQLLAAETSARPVSLGVEGCYLGFPVIVITDG